MNNFTGRQKWFTFLVLIGVFLMTACTSAAPAQNAAEGALEAEIHYTLKTGAADGQLVFIGVGGEEQTPPVKLPPGYTAEQAATLTARARMVDNSKELAARLAALKGAPGYRVETRVFPGQSHMSVPWEALNSELNFALGEGSGSPTQ